MSDCPIFAAASFLELTSRECDRLSELIVGELDHKGIKARYLRTHEEDDGSGHNRFAFEYELSGVDVRLKAPAQLLLCFDLSRPGGATSWDEGQRSMLIVAYDATPDGWHIEQLSFGTDGAFLDENWSVFLRTPDEFSGRLVTWEEVDHGKWKSNAWLLGAVLTNLTSPQDAQRSVTAPIVALLRHPENAVEILAASKLVKWPRLNLRDEG